MTRFSWLQSRAQILFAATLLAALAVAAAITGIQLSHLYSSLVGHCHTGCDLATQQFLTHDRFMDHALDLLARIVPALFGIFWGAPLLAREFETGTYRLAWTQSVSRSRWVVTKLTIGAGSTVALAGVLTLATTWWYRVLDPLTTTQYDVFDRRDIAPVAYALFAFASGALLGAVIRRTVAAMAATLALFVAVRVVTMVWIRPHLLTPLHTTVSLLRGAGPVQLGVGSRNGGALTLFAKADGPQNSWTLSSRLVTSSGRSPSSAQISAFLHQHCPNIATPPPASRPGGKVARVIGPDAGRACLDQVGRTYHLVVSYQPASRYWSFQWLEAGIYLALALAAAAACYLWITRRPG